MHRVTSSKPYVELPKIYGNGERIEIPELTIPTLSNDELLSLYKKIKPIITIDGIIHTFRDFTLEELKNKYYTWNPQLDIRTIVDKYKLDPIEEFICLNTWTLYSYFKPTIAEVLAQTSNNIREYANTFEIVEEPITRDDINKYHDVLDKGYHLSKVRAYKLHN